MSYSADPYSVKPYSVIAAEAAAPASTDVVAQYRQITLSGIQSYSAGSTIGGNINLMVAQQ